MDNVNTNVTNDYEEEPDTKLIFNPALAKYLLEEKGHPIIGLKANKDNRDKSVFVFSDSTKLRDSMRDYTKMRRAMRRRNNRPTEIKEPLEQED